MVAIEGNEQLTKYVEELEKDMEINLYNLREKSLTSSAIWAKWLNYLYHQKNNLTKLTDLKKQYTQEISSKNNLKDSILKLKNQDILEQNDEKLKRLNALIKNTTEIINFLQQALEIVANLGYTVKNAIEAFKLEMK